MKKRTACLSFSASELVHTSLRLDGAGIAFKKPKTKEEQEAVLSSFGWANNSNTYYPEVGSAKDIIPQPEDFIQVPWRMLSAGIVGAGTWKATDFSNEAVLKRSVKLIEGKPLYRNHEAYDIDNWVGIVAAPTWAKSFTNPDGTKIPAGINAVLNIDAKANPRIARGVLSNIITSNSVTVLFDWEPSHEFEDEWEFERSVGKIIDGIMVRRVVTKIYDYFETSLVWMGADPYAKKIDEDTGGHINVDVTGIHDNDDAIPVRAGETDSNVRTLESEPEKVQFSYKNNKSYHVVSSLSKHLLDNSAYYNKKSVDMDKELIKLLREKFNIANDVEITPDVLAGFTVVSNEQAAIDKKNANTVNNVTELAKKAANNDDITFDEFLKDYSFRKNGEDVDSEKVTQLTKDVNDANKKVEDLTKEKDDITAKFNASEKKVGDLTKEVEELTPFAESGKKFIQMKKDEAIRLYKTFAGENVDETVVGLFEKANDEELVGLIKQYTKGAAEKFGGRCAECGSENFEFRSTLVEEEGEGTKDKVGYAGDPDAIREKYAAKDFSIRK